MSDVKWIKITTNIFDDEKIKLIETLPDSDTLLIIWFKLLALAGRCNDSGMIYLTRDVPYNEEMLSTIMCRPINTIRLALNEFQKLGMIETVNSYIAIVNWEKHQNIDGLDRIREKTRLRVQNHREKRKEIPCNVTERYSNAIDKSREDKNRLDNIGRFTPPTIEDVSVYLAELKETRINPQTFCDYYASKGWMIGKNKMKDWKAAVRTWQNKQNEKTPKSIYNEL